MNYSTQPRHMPVDEIVDHAKQHRRDELPFDPSSRIDFFRPFVCPTLTPLFYTNIWKELSVPVQLRYTQLSALSFNELIAWFEQGFTSTLQGLLKSASLPDELKSLLPEFIEDEERHQRFWWTLNRMADPKRYTSDQLQITRIAPLAKKLMKKVAANPIRYPVAIWIMLILEEHGNEIARRCAMLRPDRIEPNFAAAYLAHVRDETRHVQIDWHLLESLWPKLGWWKRKVNVFLFRMVIKQLIFSTRNAARSVVDAVVVDCPEIQPLLPRILDELEMVGKNREYQAMMFSLESSPIAYLLCQKFPELQRILT